MHGLARIFVTLSLLAAAPAARAQTRTFAILDLKSPRLLENLGRTLSAAVGEKARALGDAVLDSRDVAGRIGEERADAAVACGLDAGCLVGALAGLKADRVVAGTFDRNETQYLVHLVHVDLATGKVVSRVDRSILIASRRLASEVLEAAPDLLEGQRERLGTLLVTSAVAGAEVLVDGKVVGRTPEVRVDLTPGKHAVVVRAKDYLELDRYVEVSPDQTTRFEAKLFLEPGKTPPATPGQETGGAPSAKRQPLGLHLPVGTWAGLGTALGLSVGGAWYGLQAQRVEHEAVDLNHDGVLDITRARAIQGRDAATTANILYGLAGVALVTAGVFAALPPGESGPAPQAGALVSPDGAFVSLGGRF